MIPIDSSLAVMSGEFNEEVPCSKERFEFHLNGDVLCLRILFDALKVVILYQLARAFVVAKEIVNCLLKFSFDL